VKGVGALHELCQCLPLPVLDQALCLGELFFKDGNGIQQGALVVMEDIGRHNTLDKISGWILNNQKSSKEFILITTGRISSEMLQKSLRIGASIVISRTSPSSLAVQMAEETGICIIGYARNNRFKIYTHIAYVIDS